MTEKRSKAERTRLRLMDAALALFDRQGYDKTTMRAIASEAGVSPGATYYYFETKEHLIHAFYQRTHGEFSKAARQIIATHQGPFKERFAAVLEAQIHVAEPFHGVSKALLRVAVDRDHPLSPFSEESAELRLDAQAVYTQLFSSEKWARRPDLAPHLPYMFWLCHMGVVLFWIYDHSPGRKRTRSLIQKLAALVTRILEAAALPFLAPMIGPGIALAEELATLTETRPTPKDP